MKKFLSIAALLSLISGSLIAVTHEFRSPLSLQRGLTHWPYAPSWTAWWYDAMTQGETKDSLWNVHTYSAAYWREAHEAYFDECDNKTTRKTKPLSTLFFGKSSFRGEEVFAGGIVNDPALLCKTNPFLAFARITPVFDYNEKGMFWGVHFDRRFSRNEKWHAGGRITIPFKVIEIEQNSNCKLEETLEDVLKTCTLDSEADANATQIDYAMRFDFLQSLAIDVNNVYVTYEDVMNGAVDGPGVQLGSQEASANAAAQSDEVPPAYVLGRTNGEMPSVGPFYRQQNQVAGALATNGSNISDDSVLFFKHNQDYSNLSRDKSGQLFVVPRYEDNIGTFTAQTRDIYNEVRTILNRNPYLIDNTASDFFRQKCIELCAHERITAIGDLETEAYVGYGDRQDWFVDFLLSFRWPTGKKAKDSKRLFFVSTGHNKHWEVKLGLEGGWKPRDWFAFKLDWAYHHAFKRTEKRAAFIKGATVKNLGSPEVDADVSWNYFVLRNDLNFWHPDNPELGCLIGYEFYAKRKDKVKFCQTTVTDCLGRADQQLDSCGLETRTDAQSHKIRGEMFHRWNAFELFAGGSHVFAGKDVAKETEAHIGFSWYF